MSEPMELNTISLGGGVQSTVMALMASAGELEPMPDAAIFADTQWEHPDLYPHLDWLEEQLAFPLIRVTAGNVGEDLANGVNSTGQQFFSVPVFVADPETGKVSITKRQCTNEYKVRPIVRAIRTELLGLCDGQRTPAGTVVTQWIGISTDEITRARVGPNKKDPFWSKLRYPLIEAGLSRQDLSAWFMERFPGRDLRKSSCVGCPYHDQETWAALQRDDPEIYAAVAMVERRASQSQESLDRFGGERMVALTRTMIPLSEIDWSARPRQSSFDEVCDGYCWT